MERDERRVGDRADSGRRRAGRRSGRRRCRRRRSARPAARRRRSESRAAMTRLPRKPAAPVTSTFMGEACYRSARDQSTQGRHRHRRRAPASAGRSRSRCCANGYAVVAGRTPRRRCSTSALQESGADRARAASPCRPTSATPQSVARAVRRRARAFGRLDVLFNNAGISAPRRAARGPDRRAMAGGGGRRT